VGKFYGDKGPSYYAIDRRLPSSTKSAAFKVILDYLRELDASGLPQELYSVGEMMTTMTTRTTPTTPTTMTTLAGTNGPALNSPIREHAQQPVELEN
jgi:hypothetical protein